VLPGLGQSSPLGPALQRQDQRRQGRQQRRVAAQQLRVVTRQQVEGRNVACKSPGKSVKRKPWGISLEKYGVFFIDQFYQEQL